MGKKIPTEMILNSPRNAVNRPALCKPNHPSNKGNRED